MEGTGGGEGTFQDEVSPCKWGCQEQGRKNKGDYGLQCCAPERHRPLPGLWLLGLREGRAEKILGGLRRVQESLCLPAHQDSLLECSLAAGVGLLFRTCQGTAGVGELGLSGSSAA